MVTLSIPITMTAPPQGTLTPLTIVMVLLWTVIPQPDTGLPPGQ
jgi:hypothetical protein